MSRERRGWLGAALFTAGVATLVLLERKRPLRDPVESGAHRIARNVAVGALTAATVSALERPVVTRVAALTAQRNWGIVPRLPFPRGVRIAIAIALMDYTLYWWHVLLHRVPLLWRMHEPHHIDRDLDTSTALRFHFTEFMASIPWRCAQIVAIGIEPRALAFWQKLTLAEVLFHHSNVRLPLGCERVLARFLVTPRMHGIHHSVVREERDSNFSSGLTLWDRLHGTEREVGPVQPTIGLPSFQAAADVTLTQTLKLPFQSDQ